ncbi:MAG: hypothetical protein IJW28_02940 [Clostridia bacterium]|nr:hypothetical protein [Clostridia bacterium]
MFIYDRIPDENIQDVIKIKGQKSSFYDNMPTKVIDVCKGLESEKYFYSDHTKSYIGTNGVRKFARSLYKYLDCHNAIKYSVNDSLQMACIGGLRGIDHSRYPKNEDGVWKVKDVAPYYSLASGKIHIPMLQQQSFMSSKGYVPSTVAEVLQDYAYYAVKCDDKDKKELLKELETLLSYQVITTKEYIEYITAVQNRKHRVTSAPTM